MEHLSTAKEFCRQRHNESDPTISWIDFNEMVMVEFAKMHVEAALKEASEKAAWNYESFDTYFGDSRDFDFTDTDGSGDPSTGHIVFVNKDSILTSYPLTNIK